MRYKYLFVLPLCALAIVIAYAADKSLGVFFARDVHEIASLSSVEMKPGSRPEQIHIPPVSEASYGLTFQAMATDDYYDNFFQTSDRASLGLELQHPGKLVLKIGEFNAEIPKVINLNQYYHYELKGGGGGGQSSCA